MPVRGLSFEDLIAPVSSQEFLARYWEKDFMHLERGREGYFDDLFSMGDIDRWLASTRSGHAESIVITPPMGADGTRGPVRSHHPREVPIEEISDAFVKGHSVVLNRLEDSWPAVSPLVHMFGAVFCADIGVNAYLTPKGSQTFPLHTDNHDVFVLQIHGEKVWRLKALEELPIMRLGYAKDLHYPAGWGADRDFPGPVIAEPHLRPGDVLYVPRGMPHCAITQDKVSLHLTVSVTTLYWVDFLKMAAEQASLQTPILRKALPPGFATDPGAPEAMRHEFGEVLRAFNERVSFTEAFEAARNNRFRSQGFPADGHFASLTDLQGLSVDTEVERREHVLCRVESSDGRSIIRFGSRNVGGPAHLLRAMELIRDRRRFRIGDLPGLDDQSRVVLARRLIREGLLRLAPRTQGRSTGVPAMAETV